MKKQTQTQADKDRDDQLIVDAIRELGGSVRFNVILDKLGWANLENYRRLDTGLQRLKRRGLVTLANMRWSA